jgi:sugar phosphate isomerase/epimerase
MALSVPYSLSTSWNAGRQDSAAAIVEEITALGFGRVELSSSLSAARVDEFAALVEAGAIQISSLHGPVPRPEEMRRGEVPEPWLSAMDPEERAHAVRLARGTMDQAQRLGASAIVLHVGRLRAPAWDPSLKLSSKLVKALQDGLQLADPPVVAITDEMRGLREEAVPAQYPGLFRALEEVAEYSVLTGVRVGLETRVIYCELPYADEFEMILERFGGGGIYYWHDAGHAQTLETQGFGSHEELLRRYGAGALGAHLHDVIYPWPDHQPPGRGIVDFDMIARLLNPEALRVLEMLEITEPVTGRHIVAGVARLREAFSG